MTAPKTHPPELVEAVARGLKTYADGGYLDHWDDIPEKTKAAYRNRARAALDAIAAVGCTVRRTEW